MVARYNHCNILRNHILLFFRVLLKSPDTPNVLRFWVEGGVISLCWFGSVLILVRPPQFCPLGLSNKWYQSRRLVVVTGSYECSLILVSRVFLTEVSGKHVPLKCVNSGTSEDSLWLRYSYLKMLSLERVRGSVPMWKGLSLEGEMCYVSKCESKSHIE